MITADDVQFMSYCTKIGVYDAEVWDYGEVEIDDLNGHILSIDIHDLQELCAVAAEFIEERKKVKAQ